MMACLTCIGISLDLTISVPVKSYKTKAQNLESLQVFSLLVFYGIFREQTHMCMELIIKLVNCAITFKTSENGGINLEIFFCIHMVTDWFKREKSIYKSCVTVQKVIVRFH